MSNRTKQLNRQNNLLDKEIKSENQEDFTNIICYLRSTSISEYHVEVIRRDLTEMVLSAQERGETIQSVIGCDYKAFCDEVISNFPPRTLLQKAVSYVNIICWCISLLLIINILISSDTIQIINRLLQHQKTDLYISLTLGSVISMGLILIISTLIVQLILKNAFHEKKRDTRIRIGCTAAFISFVFILIAWLGRDTIFTINIFMAITIAALLFFAHKVLERLDF